MKLSLIQRVSAGFSLLLILIIGLALISITAQNRLGDQFKIVAGHYSSLLHLSGSASTSLQNAIRHSSDFTNSTSAERLDTLAKAYQTEADRFTETLSHLNKLVSGKEEQIALLEQTQQAAELTFQQAEKLQILHRQWVAYVALVAEQSSDFAGVFGDLSSSINGFKRAEGRTDDDLKDDLDFLTNQAESADILLKQLTGTLDPDEVWVQKADLDRYLKYLTRKNEQIGRNYSAIKNQLEPLIEKFTAAISAEDGMVQNHLNRLELEKTVEMLIEAQSQTIEAALSSMNAFASGSYQSAERSQMEAEENIASSRQTILVFVFGAFIFVAVISVSIVRGIRQSLKAILSGINLIAEGNLETKLKTGQKDELGQIALGINELTKQMRVILTDIQQSALSV